MGTKRGVISQVMFGAVYCLKTFNDSVDTIPVSLPYWYQNYTLYDTLLLEIKVLLNKKYCFGVCLTATSYSPGSLINCSYISCVFSNQEPMDVVELFGLKGVQHTPISIKNARVSQVNNSWLLI